jgi:putative ABC transport system permease protein
VTGLYSGTNDSLFAYADYDYVRELARAPAPSAITVILDRLDDTTRVSSEIAAFDGIGKDLAIRPWNVLAGYYRQVNAMYTAFLRVIRLILFLVTVFIIANTMTMTVFERMREIGTLRAVGTTRFGIFSMLFMEGGVLGFTGCLVGIGLGFAVCAVLNLAGGVHIAYEGAVVRILFAPRVGDSFFQLVPVTLFAFFGSIVPAWKAAGLTIAETLRLV